MADEPQFDASPKAAAQLRYFPLCAESGDWPDWVVSTPAVAGLADAVSDEVIGQRAYEIAKQNPKDRIVEAIPGGKQAASLALKSLMAPFPVR